MAKKNSILAALRQASKGLTYTSESEAGLEPFLLKEAGDPDPKRIVKLAGAEEGTPVETESLSDFLYAVPPEDKPKFDKLAQVFKDQLSGVKVYKVGEDADKEVYVVGKTADGQWAGVKTSVVET
jgi:Nuclease A inhibitor-like protein